MSQFASGTAAARTMERSALIERAFLLEYLTVTWMVVEAVVAVWSGVISGSTSLVAFGLDSVIELASAGVLIWRLRVELRRGERFAENAEETARRIAGGLLLALAAYVLLSAGWKLWTRTGESLSFAGMAVTAAAIPTMYLLARAKLSVARALGSGALRADAVEAITCGWLSFAVLAGLVLEAVTGVWWADAAASLAVLWFLVREGLEALRGDDCCEGETD